MIRKANGAGAPPQCGNGKLTDYKKDGSWIMDQMKSGNPEPGIKVDKSGEHIRFAKIASNIVASCQQMCICKNYKQLSSATRNDYRFALKWVFNGALDGCTVDEINIIKEMLNAKVCADTEKMCAAFDVKFVYVGQPTLDFASCTMRTESIAEFTMNIATDAKVIVDFLNELGFDNCQEQLSNE